MICIVFVSKYLEKFANYEKKTSYFSAAPGGLGPLVMLAEHEKSDISQVATSHLIRLIVIITAFPLKHSVYTNGFRIEEKKKRRKLLLNKAIEFKIDKVYFNKLTKSENVLNKDGEEIEPYGIENPFDEFKKDDFNLVCNNN